MTDTYPLLGPSGLPTPALVLDLDALEANIATAFRLAKAAGIALRPHSKSHKSPDIAKLLAEAGSVGACTATIAEAEALAAAGVKGILVTAPQVTNEQVARIGRLLAQGADLLVTLDSPDAVAPLAEAAIAAGTGLRMLVDVDVGQARTGVLTAEAAVAVAQAIVAAPGASYAGVQAYYGHLQQQSGYADRKAMIDTQIVHLRDVLAALSSAGLHPAIVTGGGTGSFGIDRHLGVFSELQIGSFLFLDSLYGSLAIEPDGSNPFRQSLYVRAAVVSANLVGNRQPKVVINAGLKAFATDSGLPRIATGAPGATTYRYMGDEHGALMLPEGSALCLGAEVELIPSHCDPTVNLYACYHLRRNGAAAGTWPILGRIGDRL